MRCAEAAPAETVVQFHPHISRFLLRLLAGVLATSLCTATGHAADLDPSSVHSRRHERGLLEDGVSPDRRFEVVAVHDWGGGKPEFLGYAVRLRKGHRVLLALTSSYNDPEVPGNPFDIRHTESAVAAWNSTSTAVAIDEAVHRFIGLLFVVRVRAHSASELDIPEGEIVRRTKEPWGVYSIHGPDWLAPDVLHVFIHGYLGHERLQHREYDVRLRLTRRDQLLFESAEENRNAHLDDPPASAASPTTTPTPTPTVP